MGSREVTTAGYLVLLAAGVILQLLALRRGSGVPTLGAVASRCLRCRAGRLMVVAGWAWLGLHVFAR
ncbi:MAG: hypothetical protein NVSMB32_11680 [Actinomycetota bacterium]